MRSTPMGIILRMMRSTERELGLDLTELSLRLNQIDLFGKEISDKGRGNLLSWMGRNRALPSKMRGR